MPVELVRGGLLVSGSPLWFDARRQSDLSFVSHAHSDHIARHRCVVATRETVVLMEHRLGPLDEVIAAPYLQPFDVGALKIELFPAGHVLGSAQIRVTRPDGHRIVYTGDFSLGPSLTAAPTQLAECDTLLIESTFGHPKYRFPSREAVYDEAAEWARKHLSRGTRPIFLAYSLGKSQETIKQLTARGLRLCVHPAVHDITAKYRELGVDLVARRFDGEFEEDEVGVFPPFRRGEAFRALQHKATAVLTGWALEPWGARRYGADRAFPVSDHADFPSLLSYAKATGAREVITLHGFAHELAAALRKEGMFARAANERVQMELPLLL